MTYQKSASIEAEWGKIWDINSGNYAEFESDWTLHSVWDATTWDDIIGNLVASRLESTVWKLQYNYEENTITMESGGNPAVISDRLIFNFQHPHRAVQSDWSVIAEQHMHIHWKQDNANVITWQLDYRTQKNGEAWDPTWTALTSSSDTDSAFPYVSWSINQITNLGIIQIPWNSLSATVQYRLTRTDVTGLDVEAIFVDAHVKFDTMWSRQQFIK